MNGIKPVKSRDLTLIQVVYESRRDRLLVRTHGLYILLRSYQDQSFRKCCSTLYSIHTFNNVLTNVHGVLVSSVLKVNDPLSFFRNLSSTVTRQNPRFGIGCYIYML